MFYTIGHLEIPQNVILKKPLWYYSGNNNKGIQKVFKQLKELTSYQYDNTHLKWSNIFGHLFSISVYCSPKDHWDIHVWDQTGAISILKLVQPVEDKQTDVLSPENYKQLCDTTVKFVQGLIKCSDCKTEIKRSEVAGHYFASSFCEDCWKRKWKAIEAKETYN